MGEISRLIKEMGHLSHADHCRRSLWILLWSKTCDRHCTNERKGYNTSIATLGEIVHNPRVVESLAQKVYNARKHWPIFRW